MISQNLYKKNLIINDDYVNNEALKITLPLIIYNNINTAQKIFKTLIKNQFNRIN